MTTTISSPVTVARALKVLYSALDNPREATVETVELAATCVQNTLLRDCLLPSEADPDVLDFWLRAANQVLNHRNRFNHPDLAVTNCLTAAAIASDDVATARAMLNLAQAITPDHSLSALLTKALSIPEVTERIGQNVDKGRTKSRKQVKAIGRLKLRAVIRS